MVSRTSLRSTIARDTDAVVVAMTGDLDVYVAGDARAHLEEAIDRAVAHSLNRVIVDAAGIGFCDSTGLSVVVRARDSAAGRGVRLSIRNLSEPMRQLLRLTGLDNLVDDQ